MKCLISGVISQSEAFQCQDGQGKHQQR